MEEEGNRSQSSGGGGEEQHRKFKFWLHYSTLDSLQRSARSIDTMSSSTDSNATQGQQDPGLSLTSLMSAMNSGSSTAKLKARIITTDKLMQLLNKKVKGKETFSFHSIKVTDTEIQIECEALQQQVNTLKDDLEREKKLRYVFTFVFYYQEAHKVLVCREEKEEKFNEERLEMQIDNDMLKADLEEKDEEIAQLRARVATAAAAAVTAPPSPTPPSPIPAVPSQSAPVIQDNSQVLQEIEKLKKGMVSTMTEINLFTMTYMSHFMQIALQTQFAQHIKECSHQPVTQFNQQSISHSIPSTIPPSSTTTTKQPDMMTIDTVNKSQDTLAATSKSGKQASGLKPSSLRRPTSASSSTTTTKRKDIPPVSQQQQQQHDSNQSPVTSPRKDTNEADQQVSVLKPSSLRARSSVTPVTSASPQQHDSSPSPVMTKETNDAGEQLLNGLIVPKPNMNRPTNVREHVVYERDIRKGAKVLSKKGIPSASTKKNVQLASASKRKAPESERDPDPVRRPLRVIGPEQSHSSQQSKPTTTSPSSATTKLSTSPPKIIEKSGMFTCGSNLE